MQPMRVHRGQVIPMDRANVDTDQIIPKQFLKRIERTGYGPFLFNDWRYDGAGNPKPDFVLNQAPYNHGSILLAGKNFGCGSSREHAAWALANFGIAVVIAPSFADIFHSNAANNGLLTVVLPDEAMAELFAKAAKKPNYELTVNVETLTISDDSGWEHGFPLDGFRQHCLLNGLDQIGITEQKEQFIREYEARAGAY
ncbi:MAG TPA: 3-isopropylmalate dehydratase small subunit [Candidatus Saccharimonadales bacterium]|nr:3-isopropylmalate dehydratase small subunit [Candidatus Saccharimonadales bacterium]